MEAAEGGLVVAVVAIAQVIEIIADCLQGDDRPGQVGTVIAGIQGKETSSLRVKLL